MDINIQGIGWVWCYTEFKLGKKMKITIEYCVQWNYEPRALSLRDDLIVEFKDRFDEFNVELIESGGGVFEIIVNEHLQVFSKKELNRFPNSSYEIIKTINDSIDEGRLG